MRMQSTANVYGGSRGDKGPECFPNGRKEGNYNCSNSVRKFGFVLCPPCPEISPSMMPRFQHEKEPHVTVHGNRRIVWQVIELKHAIEEAKRSSPHKMSELKKLKQLCESRIENYS